MRCEGLKLQNVINNRFIEKRGRFIRKLKLSKFAKLPQPTDRGA